MTSYNSPTDPTMPGFTLWLSRARLHPVLTAHKSKEAWLQTHVLLEMMDTSTLN